MDMSQYLGVFLDEAEEQIDLMEQGILRLEEGGDSLPTLQEIFRAAHTLKGSARAMGFMEMGDLTHRMENILDRLRKEEMAVSTPVVDILFECLDALKQLKGAIVEGRQATFDGSSLLKRLEAWDTAQSPPEAAPQPAAEAPAADAEPEGPEPMGITIALAPDTVMKSVRVYMAFQTLESMGSVVKSSPSRDDLDDEKFGDSFDVFLETALPAEDVRKALAHIAEVQSVAIYGMAETAPPPEIHAPLPTASESRPLVSEPETKGQAGRKTSQTIRVDVERLDNLLNLVGELVIDRTRMVQLGMAFGARHNNDELHSSLVETASHIGRVTDELQEEIMKARMLPIEQVFNRFPRMVRDLAQKAGKEVHFIVEGKETELDRSVIEVIGDPLIHLLRNAIDHGIETSEERVRDGKDKAGQIRLSARHEENYIVIDVQDDGKGIDPAVIRASAIRKGVVSAETASRLTEQDVVNLIFAPGFSTARQVSEVSGRGVGMDIVKSNIQKLNGLIDIQSAAGEGTLFTVKLPLTLAIIRGLLVSVAGGVFAIPLTSVLEAIKLEQDRVHLISGCGVIIHRQKTLPLLHVKEVFGLMESGQVSAGAQESAYVVLVGLAEKQIGLIVDSLLGEQEVVIKSLGRYLGEIRGISGATILGDGSVALIMDVGALVREASMRQGRARPEQSAA
ncbi:MAG: chemotaxis protein CheA [Armatimonadetes bacterium]|nr:chemotaxis protein CheA [Armatimonadota bacterium]